MLLDAAPSSGCFQLIISPFEESGGSETKEENGIHRVDVDDQEREREREREMRLSREEMFMTIRLLKNGQN